MILRRSVILALGLTPLLTPKVFSQSAVNARHVGLLSSAAPLTDTNPVVVGLTAGFSERGYLVGSSLIFERRAAEAQPDRLPQLVDDLKTKAELIITQSYAAAVGPVVLQLPAARKSESFRQHIRAWKTRP